MFKSSIQILDRVVSLNRIVNSNSIGLWANINPAFGQLSAIKCENASRRDVTVQPQPLSHS